MTIMQVIAIATAIAAPEAASPPAAQIVPEASILILAKQGEGRTNRTDLYWRTVELLVTMHDLGIIRYHFSTLDPKAFDACMAMDDQDNWSDDRNKVGRNGCIGKLLPASEAGIPTVAILIENMRWRSAAQQMTCIGPEAAVIKRSAIHLKDIFHPNEAVRKGSRDTTRSCITAALRGQK